MVTRNASYRDYGISNDEVKNLLMYCRSADFDKKDLLMECANESYPQIADYLVESIVNRMSYERLMGRYYFYYGKSDFYGRRRQTLAIFKERLNGK